MKSIKKLSIIFENCESVNIETDYIGYVELSDIKNSIRKVACNCIGYSSVCETFLISIDHKIPKQTETYGDKLINPIDRLNEYKDIVSISVTYEDDSEEEIYLPWGDREYTNQYQENYINKFGDIFICISEDHKLSDFYSEKDMESEDFLQYYIW